MLCYGVVLVRELWSSRAPEEGDDSEESRRSSVGDSADTVATRHPEIDKTDLYLSVVECDDNGRTYGLGWTPSRSWRRHATAGGAGGGDGAGSSRLISSPNEPVELLRRDFQTMQTHILRVIQDYTLTQDQLREVQGRLRRME
ncbi:hypothetical protein Scep_024758 [Stephania cephalantha]|uniref:Uncharacterized protein n=1 Tax=Stephania cephalantha TaxID=152367 RepID=A0AAP0F2J4_9MAGN